MPSRVELKMKFLFVILVTACLLISGNYSANSSELYQFAMYHSGSMTRDDCALVPRHVKEKNVSGVFPGQLNEHGCLVNIPSRLYEEHFQFCYFAGFNVYKVKNPEMIECVVQKRENDYVFLASASAEEDISQLMCYFTCIGKEEK